MTLAEALKKHGIEISPQFNAGILRNGPQWLSAKEIRRGDKLIQWAAFGDFKRDIADSWRGSDQALTPDEEKEIAGLVAETEREQREAREAHWAEVAPKLEAEFNGLTDLGTVPYLVRKKIDKLFGARIMGNEHGDPILCVPLRDVTGKLWNFQRVYSQKLSKGDKFFHKGARIEGLFHLLGELAPESTVRVCEGFATGASIFMALGEAQPVVCAFNANNLLPVAQALRKAHPQLRFIFCGDNDQWTEVQGRLINVGKVKAQKAAREVGGNVVLPKFKPAQLDSRPTDFNDLHVLAGLDEVKFQLLNPNAVSSELQCLAFKGQDGKQKKPGEKAVATALLDYYGDNLVTQGRDLFIYRDGYWQWQSPEQVNRLKQQIGFLYGPGAGVKDIENAYKYMLIHAPTPPKGIDLFVPPYFAANFKNGTLHITLRPGKEPLLEFREHSREDYLTTQLPFAFPGLDRLDAQNEEFDAMLARIFLDDPDKEAKVRVLAQMFGAVIMPCYAKVFFLVGPKGSGKSTVMKILSRLVDPRNISHVDPSHFVGFNMETMAGKLLNMDTDIDLHKPIQDSVIKKITDRVPFRVARKFQTDLLVPIAPVHIFGANELPRSMEGATGAYERRVIIVKFGGFSAEKLGAGNYEIDYDELVWSKGPAGILAFAIRGLIDLARSRGHFSVPQSSREELRAWDQESDEVARFVEDVKEGLVADRNNRILLDPEARIERKHLYEIFKAWSEESQPKVQLTGRTTFFQRFASKGFGVKTIMGVRYFLGIGVQSSAESTV